MGKAEEFSGGRCVQVAFCLCFLLIAGGLLYSERRIIALEYEVEALRSLVVRHIVGYAKNDMPSDGPSIGPVIRAKRYISNEEISGEERNAETPTPTPETRTEVNIIRRNSIPTPSAKPLVKSLQSRNYQDESEFESQRPKHRQRHRQKMVETFDEQQFTVLKPTRKHVPAVHFTGDSSKYTHGVHPNFNGNGHMRHLSKTYVDWQPSDWVESLHMLQHFTMHNGVLTVKEPGLYLVYAQIYYLDKHDLNGYMIYKNGHSIMQCTTMTHSTLSVMKSNTCHTSGVEHFMEGDTLHVQDLSDGRYTLFEPEKSFFGAVKLSDTRMK